MPRAGWLLRWLYPGRHLSAAVAYGRELTASANGSGYLLILLAFPVIGLALGFVSGLPADQPGSPPGHSSPPRPPRPPDPEPAPDPCRLAAADPADGDPLAAA